ncbi:60 kDa SS-A/Ro ribonucleoprotein-like isoform X2 [Ctenocephalides felis]|uniref:60 kDa SS-A/Ro ribonucleoprotein-like isoform X2 n=1 Tax=Ctenocephalides felis TaxID=7515 RepID=UPI000E6E2613|nr:60 kDa SS-A/Ro ribonucleoprotein-like isoform X2 [Ctenocephalides felis]
MEVPVASAEVLLKRFLYISETECAYVPGNVFAHQFKKNQETVYDLILQLQNGEKHILIEKIFKDYLKSGKTPNNDNAIYALALCCRRGDVKTSTMCYKLLSEVCSTSEDLMLFVKFLCNDFVETKKGFGKGTRKAISRWYLSQEPLQLAKAVGFCKSKHGRSHKDILTMAHIKTDDQNINAILAYAVNGYQKAKEKVESVEGMSEEPYFKLLSDLNDFKSCDDAEKASHFIEVYHFPVTLTTNTDNKVS